MDLEAILSLTSAVAAIAGLILLAPGPNKGGGDDSLRPGWVIGLILLGLAFFWFGVSGVAD